VPHARDAFGHFGDEAGGNGRRVRRMPSARILSSARDSGSRNTDSRIDVEAAGNDRGAFCPAMGEEKDPL
jgi:hypothetical protein